MTEGIKIFKNIIQSLESQPLTCIAPGMGFASFWSFIKLISKIIEAEINEIGEQDRIEEAFLYLKHNSGSLIGNRACFIHIHSHLLIMTDFIGYIFIDILRTIKHKCLKNKFIGKFYCKSIVTE